MSQFPNPSEGGNPPYDQAYGQPYQTPNDPYQARAGYQAYPGQDYGYGAPPPTLGWSGLGLTSMLMSVAAFVFCLGGIIAVGVVVAKNPEIQLPNGSLDPNHPAIGLVGLGGLIMMLGMLLALVGGVLGVVGLFQPRAKLLPILGLMFNALVGVGVVGLMVLGNLVSP